MIPTLVTRRTTPTITVITRCLNILHNFEKQFRFNLPGVSGLELLSIVQSGIVWAGHLNTQELTQWQPAVPGLEHQQPGVRDSGPHIRLPASEECLHLLLGPQHWLQPHPVHHVVDPVQTSQEPPVHDEERPAPGNPCSVQMSLE